jgi:hypothetical protein
LASLLGASALSLAVAATPPSKPLPRKKKLTPSASTLKTPPEVYSATEAEDFGNPVSAAVPSPAPAEPPLRQVKPPKSKLAAQEQPIDAGSPAPEAPTPSVAPPPLAARSEPRGFEAIPDRHIESIAGRLQLVERLIREFGRAYDYRTHTTRELERILVELRVKRERERPANVAPPAQDGPFLMPEEQLSAPGALPRGPDEPTAPMPTLFGQND